MNARHFVPFALALVAAAPLAAQRPRAGHAASPAPPASILADIRFLASDALEGRLAGSAGADSAAAYLARRMRRLGLAP